MTTSELFDQTYVHKPLVITGNGGAAASLAVGARFSTGTLPAFRSLLLSFFNQNGN